MCSFGVFSNFWGLSPQGNCYLAIVFKPCFYLLCVLNAVILVDFIISILREKSFVSLAAVIHFLCSTNLKSYVPSELELVPFFNHLLDYSCEA